MFVEWPEDTFPFEDSPIVIGIVGRDPFGSAIDVTVRGKRVNKRRFIIKRLQRTETVQDCHIVFISSSERKRIGELMDHLKDIPVLTVSEIPGFARRGGIINFRVEDNKVRFDINADAAKRAGFKLNSQLLRVAAFVHKDKRGKHTEDR